MEIIQLEIECSQKSANNCQLECYVSINVFCVWFVLQTLICTRLCQSLVLGLQSFKVKCDPYVLTTQKKGWFVLRQLHSETRQNITDVWNKLLKPYGMMLKETAH